MGKNTLDTKSAEYAAACQGRLGVYIDSFNLYHGIRAGDKHAFHQGGLGWKHCNWYDPQTLAQALVPEKCTLGVVRFFTARTLGGQPTDSTDQADERERQRLRQVAVLDAIQARGTQLIEGVYSPQTSRCKTCKAEWPKFEEKLTDTKIAVSIMVDAMHGRFDTCVIVGADADMAPPLEGLKEEFPNIKRLIASPPNRNPKHHLKALASCFKLTREVIESAIMPNPVTRGDGFDIFCPAEWSPRSYLSK